jgi:hypothetical protein
MRAVSLTVLGPRTAQRTIPSAESRVEEEAFTQRDGAGVRIGIGHRHEVKSATGVIGNGTAVHMMVAGQPTPPSAMAPSRDWKSG